VHDLSESLRLAAFQRALLEAVLVGALGGAVGAHVLLRRLPFFVVAMSHATFPGVVLASIVGVSLFIGGIGAGLVVVAAVLVLGRATVLDESSAIGVVLAGSFAVGVLILSARPGGSRDLSAYLVGSILSVTRGDLVTTAVIGVAVTIALIVLHKELVFSAFDRAGADALGYATAGLDLVVLLVVTVTLVTLVPAVGTLLAISLLTVPAMTARLWTERVGTLMPLAAALGAAAGVLGLLASAAWSIAAGGAIALASAALFVASIASHRGRHLGGHRGQAVTDLVDVGAGHA
jgi:manganese/iron transport system permease protein